MMKSVADMVGCTVKHIENVNNEKLVFTMENGEQYQLYHEQDWSNPYT